MATKRLARTVIEGGRHGYNKYERRYSSKVQRAQTREYISNIMKDPDFCEFDVEPDRDPVYKEFSDKLSPMYRWLDAQIGRPWSEVRSEVFQNFDTRTTAGRHITFDHLLREVVDSDSGFDEYGNIVDPEIPKIIPKGRRYYRGPYADYYVDRAGILRAIEDRHKRVYRRWEPISEADAKEAEDFLRGRMILEKGGKLHWLAPSEDIWRATWTDLENKHSNYSYSAFYPNKLRYYILENGEHEIVHNWTVSGYTYSTKIKTHGNFWKEVEHPFSFRLRGELTQEEAKKFKSLRFKLRQDILKYSEGR